MRRRKREEKRRFIFISILTLCLVFVLGITFGSFLSRAKGKDHLSEERKCYASIQICSGDTLWKLADQYLDAHYATKEEYINEVIRINSLTSENHIVSGQYLILPYYERELP
ncbi:MAG: LysM peptidoglycan-binding domain-containing protein [Lachnospiraceae bacterium]|nr:LysM peptidoglycan-binding domain-containing protein [Lachnospiraceae bacterium]